MHAMRMQLRPVNLAADSLSLARARTHTLVLCPLVSLTVSCLSFCDLHLTHTCLLTALHVVPSCVRLWIVRGILQYMVYN